jgi:hypothetical protein
MFSYNYGNDETEHSDTVEIVEYAGWVEHEHSKNQTQSRPDDEWYKKRIGWISTIRSMNETMGNASRETVGLGEEVLTNVQNMEETTPRIDAVEIS